MSKRRCDCDTSIEAVTRRYQAFSKRFRKEIAQDPQKAKEFLLHAGIIQRVKGHPSRFELVPELRSAKDATC